MIDKYKEVIQGARECVEKGEDGNAYIPNLLVVIACQQEAIGKLREHCETLLSINDRTLDLCDDKDDTIKGLFETIENWEKLYEGAKYLAYSEFARELKCTSGLITRRKIDNLLRKKESEE
jgi:hypothetical protein